MRSVAVGILGGLILAGTAGASSFTVTVTLNSMAGSTPVSLSGSGSDSFPGTTFKGFAFAGSFAGVTGNATNPGGDINSLAQIYTSGGMNITDLMICPTVGPCTPGGTVSATVTLPFQATFKGEYTHTAGPNSDFSGGINFSTNWGSPTDIGLLVNDSDISIDDGGSGWTSNLSTTDSVTTVGSAVTHDISIVWSGQLQFTRLLPVGSPISAAFGVIGNCGAGSVEFSKCSFDALDPWGFIPGFDAFLLPDGFTVNAESIGLVNGFVPGALPEPGPGVLAGSGCVLIMGLRLLRAFSRKRS